MNFKMRQMTLAIMTILFYPDAWAELRNTHPVASPSTQPAQAAQEKRQQPSVEQVGVGQKGIKNIRFERGTQGDAVVIFDLGDQFTPIDLQQDGQKITARILNQPIEAKLLQRLNVQDFATLVKHIDAFNQSKHGVVQIETDQAFDYLAYQAEKKLLIRIRAKQTPQKQAASPYRGKKISLDFQDIELRRVLQVLAEYAKVNIVTSDAVQGHLSLNLKDVPWDEALDLILKTKGLDKRLNGNTYLIAPMAEFIKSEEEAARFMAQSGRAAPLHTEYIALKYAKATDIIQLISRAQQAGSGMRYRSDDTVSEKSDTAKASITQQELNENNGSMLSPRGRVAVDQRTNTLIVTDTHSRIEQICKMIDVLDIAVKQVMIETRIVRANTDVSREMGVKWGFLSMNKNLHVGGSNQTLWDLRTPTLDRDTGRPKYSIKNPDYLNVDLGIASDEATRMAFGILNIPNAILDLELSALQADGYAEVISTPKVMTADKQKAKVASGQEVPYLTREVSGGNTTSNTAFKQALLSLDVTPSITPDGQVQMQLNITNDSPGGIAPNGQVILNKNSLDTNVLVRNGETVVLGGIFEQDTRSRQTKVPVLGSIPVLGRLFRRDEKTDKKSELLIFVTPRIVNDSFGRNH